MLYSFLWVIPGSLNFIFRRFGTPFSIFIGGVSRQNLPILLTYNVYEDGTECSKTSAYEIQTFGNHPKERVQHLHPSPAPHFRTSKVFRMYFSKCPHFRTIQRCAATIALLALWQSFFCTPHVPYSSVDRNCHQWDASHRLRNTGLDDVRETVSKSVRNCINKDRSRTTSIVNLPSFCCQFRHCNSFYHSFLCWQAITLGYWDAIMLRYKRRSGVTY